VDILVDRYAYEATKKGRRLRVGGAVSKLSEPVRCALYDRAVVSYFFSGNCWSFCFFFV
jgi:hypothetical protein